MQQDKLRFTFRKKGDGVGGKNVIFVCSFKKGSSKEPNCYFLLCEFLEEGNLLFR